MKSQEDNFNENNINEESYDINSLDFPQIYTSKNYIFINPESITNNKTGVNECDNNKNKFDNNDDSIDDNNINDRNNNDGNDNNNNENDNDENNNDGNNNQENINDNNMEEEEKFKNRNDCLRKKLKHLVLKNFLSFINKKIKNKNNHIKLLDYSIIAKTTIGDEKSFMYKTLGEIFSDKISKKFTSLTEYERENNNKVNIKILKENKELKDIFDITFIQCLNHYIGKVSNDKLKRMKTFEQYKSKGENHKRKLKRYGLNYDELVNNSKEIKKEKEII